VATITVAWQQSTFEQTTNDQARMGIAFLDSFGALIGSITWATLIATPSDPTNTVGNWTPRNISASVPVGAITLRVYMEMVRRSGFNNDGYIDAITVDKDGIFLLFNNPAAELGNTSFWTNEVGHLGVRSSGPAPYSGSYYFTGGTAGDVTTRAYQDYTLVHRRRSQWKVYAR
jgi:hypothetical protein